MADVGQFLERAFPDHSIGEKLREDAEGTSFRGRRIGDGEAVLFVTSVAEHPSSEWLARLEREFALREDLELPWAARPLALVRAEGRMVLLLEDPGGLPLDGSSGRFSIAESLRVALGVAASLSGVHAKGLLHKDVKPAHILADPASGAAALTGFGLATHSRGERQESGPPETLSGTLAYMAPEQTGRMNRPVDARSDLYSLGVVLYEALTGRRPFTAADPSELLHSHLARRAVPPADVDPALPVVVSDLVMKLLAKPPEERYQTALGVEADLRRCLTAWEAQGRIEAFALAQDDMPDRPLPLKKLYGREAEEATLRSAWQRVASGAAPELLLVSGAPGAGKSSLVNALRRDMQMASGLFAAGKFDEQKKNIPYASLAQAFQHLIRQLLVQPQEEIARWRQVLEAAVHPNGRVLTDILPDLELLSGPHEEVPELAPREAKNRFLMTFNRFLDALATQEHPLVLFLDDLQWLDPATLELFGQAITQPERRYLLLLGAYRDNEVDTAHPLRMTLSSLRAAGVLVQDIVLGPLTEKALVSLLADMLQSPPDRVVPLARLVREKTEGNPFFALQFVTALHEERLLLFAPHTGGWTFDLKRILAKGYTDNVVDLLAGRIDRLSVACRKALQVLACLGIRAETQVLLRLLGNTEELVLGGAAGEGLLAPLQETERAGLLIRHGNSHAFIHDRIREAAYASISPPERAMEHVRLARLLLAARTAEQVEDEVFELVNQFNRGLTLLASAGERDLVRRLNLQAGRKSRAAIAYAAAREYLAQASELLPKDAWTQNYAEAFATGLELAECSYLVGRFEEADSLFREILETARNALDRARALSLRVRLYETSGQYRDALDTGLEALRLLGVAIPDTAEDIWKAVELEKAEVPALLGGRGIADLALVPDVSDPRVRASLDLIADTLTAVYLVKPELYPWFIFRGLTLSLRHGNTAASCLAYSHYACLLVGLYRDIPSALAFSEMSLALNAHFGDAPRRGALLFFHGGTVSPWARPLLECKAILEQAIEASLQAGDHPYVLYNASMSIWVAVESAESIEEIRNNCKKYRALAERIHRDPQSLLFRMCEQFFLSLQGPTIRPPSLEDGVLAEEASPEAFQKVGWDLWRIYYHLLKLVAAFTFGKLAEALEHADEAWEAQGKRPLILLQNATHVFYHALTLTALSPQVPPERQAAFAKRLEEFLAHLKYWADHCPETFLSRHALVVAEISRLQGRDLEAMKAYSQAIASARENRFLFLESLAYELAARFYLGHGIDKTAYAHLRDARAGYLRWGAHAKVAQLDRLYPGIEKPAASGPTATFGASLDQFDLANVVKASQAVSGEIAPEKLVEKLMGLVMDHAGADRGLLILPDGDGFVVEAEAALNRRGLAIRQPRTPLAPDQIADGVFRYVLRTRERVILEDASCQGLFTEDPYVRGQKSKSILGLPLLKQSRLLGVLYLENSLAPGVFTQSRVIALEVLASQAAISLENARLFAELEQEKSRLQASEERFSKAFQSNPTPMAVIRAKDSTFVDANERFGHLLGYAAEEIYGRDAVQLGTWFMSLLGEAGKRLAAGGLFRDEEVSATAKSGEAKALLVSVEFIMLGGDSCYLATFVDLTERKRVEEQLRQSQKMEAIGSLAGGVAHDFNNVLTAINGFSELAMMRMDASSEEYDHLRTVRSSGERAASLTRQLLAFSRKETVQTQVQGLNAIVAEMQGMLRRLIEENVEIQTCLDPEARPVNVDKGQVVQILMNLVVNARDAMPNGGRIFIETRRVRLEKPTPDTLLNAAPGGYAALLVKDTGTGMTPEVKAKIFEPFFTTKEVGKGTGLGLAVVYGVVKQLCGGIDLQSEPGQGTTFCIYLPEVREDTIAASEAAARDKPESYRGSETILVVEDEDTVRKFMKRALTAQGYQVLECRNGVEALDLLQHTEQPLDLVLTDLIMPDMGGRELATHVRAHRPGLPVLYTSGYSKEEGGSREPPAKAEYFLPKPFGPLDLARKVREVLEHSRRGA